MNKIPDLSKARDYEEVTGRKPPRVTVTITGGKAREMYGARDGEHNGLQKDDEAARRRDSQAAEPSLSKSA